MSNVIWCLAKMSYRLNAEGMGVLFGLVHQRLAAWKKQQFEPPPFNSQEISNVLYAIASMGYDIDPEGELAHLLLDSTRARLSQANAQELSNMMWSLARLQVRLVLRYLSAAPISQDDA